MQFSMSCRHILTHIDLVLQAQGLQMEASVCFHLPASVCVSCCGMSAAELGFTSSKHIHVVCHKAALL